MFRHSAKSLFDLWLFLLRRPQTTQALLETSSPSWPLLLERTGQSQHRGLDPLLLSNIAAVASLTSHRELICQTGLRTLFLFLFLFRFIVTSKTTLFMPNFTIPRNKMNLGVLTNVVISSEAMIFAVMSAIFAIA